MIRKTTITFAFLFLLFTGGFAQSTLQYSSFADLQNTIIKDQQHIIILNFWATWCKPCVAELPDFEKIYDEYNSRNVLVILVNLDFHSKVEEVLPGFIAQRNLQSKVVHLTDQDPNDWVGKVDESWTGSIPATIVYYKGEEKWFFEGQTDHETLKSVITKYISQ